MWISCLLLRLTFWCDVHSRTLRCRVVSTQSISYLRVFLLFSLFFSFFCDMKSNTHTKVSFKKINIARWIKRHDIAVEWDTTTNGGFSLLSLLSSLRCFSCVHVISIQITFYFACNTVSECKILKKMWKNELWMWLDSRKKLESNVMVVSTTEWKRFWSSLFDQCSRIETYTHKLLEYIIENNSY